MCRLIHTSEVIPGHHTWRTGVWKRLYKVGLTGITWLNGGLTTRDVRRYTGVLLKYVCRQGVLRKELDKDVWCSLNCRLIPRPPHAHMA